MTQGPIREEEIESRRKLERMLAESAISAITILLVAARAVNIFK